MTAPGGPPGAKGVGGEGGGTLAKERATPLVLFRPPMPRPGPKERAGAAGRQGKTPGWPRKKRRRSGGFLSPAPRRWPGVTGKNGGGVPGGPRGFGRRGRWKKPQESWGGGKAKREAREAFLALV